MSVHRAERIHKDSRFRIAPLNVGRSPNRKPFIVGFDSEAEDGIPFMFQFSLPNTAESDCILMAVAPGLHKGLHTFMTAIHRIAIARTREYIIFGFNLTYEFTQLFHDIEPMVRLVEDFTIPYIYDATDETQHHYTIRVANEKRHFVTIRNDETHVTIKLYDAASYFPTSLDRAAKSVGIESKLDKPPTFTRADSGSETFRAYAARDAFITRRLGEQIMTWHEQYDVRTCISAPHFASSVFRRQFLTATIPLAEPVELEQYGLASYHGGKNGYYRGGPTAIPDVFNYDIRSAYPEAMRQLPDPTQSEWETTSNYRMGSHGIWRISGDYQPCTFGGMQTLDGSWNVQPGPFVDAFVTGYEIDRMLAHGEISIRDADGWIMAGPSGGPLVEYVDQFYEQKRTATDPTLKLLAKLLLNSLYGKFFQKVAIGRTGTLRLHRDGSMEWTTTDPDQPYDYVAGGLYHPPIASLITGFVRAKIHGLEHKYDAIMTSTDGLFATRPPDPTDIGDRLGSLDVTAGRLRIWRERLYIFDSHDGEQKYALHGFRGKVGDLEAIPLAPGQYEYDAQQVITLALSTRRLNGVQYAPGTFARLPFMLDLSAHP